MLARLHKFIDNRRGLSVPLGQVVRLMIPSILTNVILMTCLVIALFTRKGA